MIDINNLQSTEVHEKITKLELPEIGPYKAVALIHLDKYQEALKYCIKGSYESAYIYYKLKKFCKALKIVNKNSGEKWDVLKSQILYRMGFFNSAFNCLSKLPRDDDIVVNLQAIKSMGILTNSVNNYVFHKLYIKKKEEINYDNLENYKFKNQSSYQEYLYNKTFEVLDKKEQFINDLKKLLEQFPNNLVIKNQLLNVEGNFDEIIQADLNKTQRSILNYNMHTSEDIDNNLHFLANFREKMGDSQYKWIKYAGENNFKIDWNKIPKSTDALNILRILVGLINKNMNLKNIKKHMNIIKDSNIKGHIENYTDFIENDKK